MRKNVLPFNCEISRDIIFIRSHSYLHGENNDSRTETIERGDRALHQYV